jgi:hypothetical protein
MALKVNRSQRCPKQWAERKLRWLNDATADHIVWLLDLSTPEVDGSVLLVERTIGYLAPAPLGCTCGNRHRDIGYHAKSCGLVGPPKTEDQEKADEPAKPSLSPAKKAPAKAAASTTRSSPATTTAKKANKSTRKKPTGSKRSSRKTTAKKDG